MKSSFHLKGSMLYVGGSFPYGGGSKNLNQKTIQIYKIKNSKVVSWPSFPRLTKLTGLYRTVSTVVPYSSIRLIQIKMACEAVECRYLGSDEAIFYKWGHINILEYSRRHLRLKMKIKTEWGIFFVRIHLFLFCHTCNI